MKKSLFWRICTSNLAIVYAITANVSNLWRAYNEIEETGQLSSHFSLNHSVEFSRTDRYRGQLFEDHMKIF